jgi:hypothetical protein
MTIDDNVVFLNEAKKFYEEIANNPSLNETIKTYFTIESLESAITIMRKYQKITEIVKAWNNMNSFDSMLKISEVLEDGDDN